MKKIRLITQIFLIMFLMGHVNAQTGTEILKKMDEIIFSAKDLSATNKIVIIDKNGKQDVREATIIQKGDEMRLLRFTSPASQAGIAMLSLPNDVMYIICLLLPRRDEFPVVLRIRNLQERTFRMMTYKHSHLAKNIRLSCQKRLQTAIF